MTRHLARTTAALVPVLIVVGLTSEWVRSGPDTPVLGGVDTMPRWIADLATGWLIACAGLLAWVRFPASLVGRLLVVMGLAWFAGNLSGSRVPEVGWIATQLHLVYLGPFAHILVTYPSGRVAARVEGVVVVVGYVAAIGLGALAGPLWEDAAGGILLATVVAGATFHGYAMSKGALRRARLLAFQMAALVWALQIDRIRRVPDANGR